MALRSIYEDDIGLEIEDVEEQSDRVQINPEHGHAIYVVSENSRFSVYESGGMGGFETLGAGRWKRFVDDYATEADVMVAHPQALWST